jgi:hypothetical protein
MGTWVIWYRHNAKINLNFAHETKRPIKIGQIIKSPHGPHYRITSIVLTRKNSRVHSAEAIEVPAPCQPWWKRFFNRRI